MRSTSNPRRISTPSTDSAGHLESEAISLRTRMLAIGGAVVAAPALALVAPFWATAELTRSLPRVLRLEPPGTVGWEALMQYLPEVGWRTRANLNIHTYADDVFHLTTDREGWRGSLSLDNADIVVFGDSYAFGHGVDDNSLYTEHTEGFSTKALGSNGYSMVHAVLWMERLQPRIAGKSVAWLIYPGNDLFDNLKPNYGRYRMPFVRRDGEEWGIYTDHVSSDPWPFAEAQPSYLTELARMCTPGLQSDRALDGAAYLIERAKRACQEVGARLIVLSVPRRSQIDPRLRPGLRDRSPDPNQFDATYPDRYLRRRCDEISVPFVPLAEHLRPTDYQSHDIHWLPTGHAKVGRLLAQLHRDLSPTSQ